MDFTHREKKASALGFASKLKVGFVAMATLLGAGFGATACLDRPLCDKDCRPRTTNVFVDTVTQKTVDKIDLLFMIDNSISMADKQEVLKDAVPDLVKRLVSPNCVNEAGVPGQTPDDPAVRCADGFEREFVAIKNIHIGVITSSLGGHGADECKGQDGTGNPRDEEGDDHGYLIAKRPRFGAELAQYPGAQQPEAQGFLDWNPVNGKGDITAFNNTFKAMVTAADEFGCGYEAQLEAVHRFLSDPNPYKDINVATCPGTQNFCAYPTGIDEELKAQRAAFLRADSLVAVIMVTDENDCSIQDTQQAYYAARSDIFLPRATANCNVNPNDPCCRSCISGTPAGCDEDPTCKDNDGITRKELDQANLRCFNQKKRFGFDFLYPTDRYVNALSQTQLCTSRTNLAVDPTNPNNCPDANGDGQPDLEINPLYRDLSGQGLLPRDKSLVFYAGIVGVPWQDLKATRPVDPKLADYPADELHYQVASQMTAAGTWDLILGNPSPKDGTSPVAPKNTLMLESIQARGGVDGQGNALAPVSGTRLQNPVNSHEWGNTGLDDLMYACVFELKASRDCTALKALPPPRPGCDCDPLVPGDNNPLCQQPDGQYSTTQQFAKAYPGIRELEVLKGYGNNSIVASICARNLKDASKQDYGYRPAVDAIVDRLKEALTGRCLPRKLKPDATTNKIPCSIIEVRSKKAAPNGCEQARERVPAPTEVITPAIERLRAAKTCDAPGQPACTEYLFCELNEYEGQECHQSNDVTKPGWCYVDPDLGDNPALVANCQENEKRIIRFVGEQTPASDAQVLIACFGADPGEETTVTMMPAESN